MIKFSVGIDGNNKIFFPVCEDTESWEHVILCGSNKVQCDEWSLKLKIKLDKTQTYKKAKEEQGNIVKK